MNDNHDKRILIAEPDKCIADALKEFLIHAGYVADIIDDRELVARKAAEGRFGVVIVDHLFNASGDTQILEALLETDPTICVIVMTSYPLVECVISDYRKGAFDVLVKPVDLFELNQIVARAFRQYRLNCAYRLVAENLDRIEQLIASDEPQAAREVFDLVE